MTITLGWWALPIALFFLGSGCAIGNAWWDRQHSSGGMGDMFNGCLGAIACLLCWFAAIGVCIGRWLA